MPKEKNAKKAKLTLTDKELIELARGIGKRQEKLNDKQAEIDADKLKIVNEMAARGTRSLDNSGWRVTVVQGQTTSYNTEGLRAELSKEQRKLVEEKVLSMKLVSQAVQAGRIDPKTVDKYTTIKDSKPYYRLSPTDKP